VLKSGITKACFYDPEVNRSYAEMAAHYGTAKCAAVRRRARGVELHLALIGINRNG
jgi:hypothetical protein